MEVARHEASSACCSCGCWGVAGSADAPQAQDSARLMAWKMHSLEANKRLGFYRADNESCTGLGLTWRALHSMRVALEGRSWWRECNVEREERAWQDMSGYGNSCNGTGLR